MVHKLHTNGNNPRNQKLGMIFLSKDNGEINSNLIKFSHECWDQETSFLQEDINTPHGQIIKIDFKCFEMSYKIFDTNNEISFYYDDTKKKLCIQQEIPLGQGIHQM